MFAWLKPRRAAADAEAALSAARQAFAAGDFARAHGLWAALAEGGNPRAVSNLAGLYAEGFGVERNPEEAARLFRIAAEAGDAIAQQNLALLFYEGRGTDGDLAEAARWYRRAAE